MALSKYILGVFATICLFVEVKCAMTWCQGSNVLDIALCTNSQFCCGGSIKCCDYWWVIVAAIVGFFLIIVLPIILCCVCNRRRNNPGTVVNSRPVHMQRY